MILLLSNIFLLIQGISSFSPNSRSVLLRFDVKNTKKNNYQRSDLLHQSSDNLESDISDDVKDAGFKELGLTPSLLEAVDIQGWRYPTPIQKLTIPSILSFTSSPINKESELLSEADDARSNSIWAEAPTGSGKTAAFALPLVQLILSRKRDIRQKHNLAKSYSDRNSGGGITSLIISPTRELALQIAGVIEEIVEGMSSSMPSTVDIDIQVITGGTPLEPQIKKLAKKKSSQKDVDIVIATPGRLVDVLLNSKKSDTKEVELEKKLLQALDTVSRKDASLSLEQLNDLKINESIASGDDGGRSAIQDMAKSVQYLVLDEADRLLSHGFRKEMDDVMKLLPTPQQREETNTNMKVCLFSASFPQEIEPRVDSFLRSLSSKNSLPPLRLSCLSDTSESTTYEDDEEISGRQRKRMEQTTKPSAILQAAASTIDLRSIRIEERDRTQALIQLINSYGKEKWDRVLVFVATRYSAEHVTRKLRRKNIKASELHGKLDFDARKRRLDDFKKGQKIQVLIATDLASRGLDVKSLPAVVNYDLPRSAADWIHRIGRTGRAGSKGTAVTFITPTNQNHFELIEKRYFNGKSSAEKEVLKGFEPNEDKWEIKEAASVVTLDGVTHSDRGLAHDKMFGGVKGRRRSKKDKLREKKAKEMLKANKS